MPIKPVFPFTKFKQKRTKTANAYSQLNFFCTFSPYTRFGLVCASRRCRWQWSTIIDSATCVNALSCSLDGAWLLALSKNGIPDTRVCLCVIHRSSRTNKIPFFFVVGFLCFGSGAVAHTQQTIVQFIYDLLIADCVVVFKFSLQFESSTFTHTHGEWWWQTVWLFRQLGMNKTRMHLVRTWGQCQQMHRWLNDKDDDGDDKQGNEAKMPRDIDLCARRQHAVAIYSLSHERNQSRWIAICIKTPPLSEQWSEPECRSNDGWFINIIIANYCWRCWSTDWYVMFNASTSIYTWLFRSRILVSDTLCVVYSFRMCNACACNRNWWPTHNFLLFCLIARARRWSMRCDYSINY